jgi:hypothetical protein
MLDRAKVLHELQSVSDKLFLDLSHEQEVARKAWQELSQDPLFQQKCKGSSLPWSVPTWNGDVNQSFKVQPLNIPYQVLSVDGSQVYPDKHQGISCFLLNIGTVVLRYGVGPGTTRLSTEPFVFVEQDFDSEIGNAVDIVNCKREEFELEKGLEQCILLRQEFPDLPLIFLFDGSLIFWHLEGKDPILKNYFLKKYEELLEGFYKNDITIAGYISLPKSKELVNLVRAQVSEFSGLNTQALDQVKHISDGTVARFFLENQTRSIVFENHAPVSETYPAHLKPYFFYYHAGSEIARIEIPAYVAHDSERVNLLISLVADQVKKGNGYPVAIAEAHEQAVVKGPDRDFFYQAIGKVSIEQRQRLIPSQKSAKKRRMNV